MDFNKLQEVYEQNMSGAVLIVKERGKNGITIRSMVTGGPVMQLHMIMEAMKEALADLFAMENEGIKIFDADRKEELLDGVFELMKKDILENLEEKDCE